MAGSARLTADQIAAAIAALSAAHPAPAPSKEDGVTKLIVGGVVAFIGILVMAVFPLGGKLGQRSFKICDDDVRQRGQSSESHQRSSTGTGAERQDDKRPSGAGSSRGSAHHRNRGGRRACQRAFAYSGRAEALKPMTPDEARAILIEAFVTVPNLPDDMKAQLARLIAPPVPVKKPWWRRS